MRTFLHTWYGLQRRRTWGVGWGGEVTDDRPGVFHTNKEIISGPSRRTTFQISKQRAVGRRPLDVLDMTLIRGLTRVSTSTTVYLGDVVIRTKFGV